MSQTQQILEALERGETLTALDALDRWGCFRLAARIQEIEGNGHKILASPRKLRSGKTVAQYRLAQIFDGPEAA